MKNITIKDVANKAGVSVATVSRVINNSEFVIDDTRTHVLKIVKELRYTPNNLARSLSRKKNESIGMLLPDLFSEFFSEVIRGVDQVVKENKYHLFVSSSHNNKDDIEAALNMMRGRVDGLIIMSPDLDVDILNPLIAKNTPVVILNSKLKNSNHKLINYVSINNFEGAFNIVEHLIKHNHKDIAIIKGEEENFEAIERYNGYINAMKKYNLVVNHKYEFHGNFTEESGYEAGEKYLQLKNKPTAIFATNDSMAIGFMIKIKEAGLDIPKDIAVCGFDDIPISKYFTPKLSTVHVPISEIGLIAANKIFDSLNNETNGSFINTLIDTNIVLRESCGNH